MSLNQIIVTIAGLLGIAGIYWFFFAKKEKEIAVSGGAVQIVVDGNTVQKRAAEKTLLSLGRSIPVIALVKNERHRPRELLGDKEPGVKHRSEILLANSEAHRFALKFQRKRRRIA